MPVTSIRQLAARVNRSDRAVRRWLDHKRFPVKREAPWSDDDVQRIRAWSATLNPNYADVTVRASARAATPGDDEKDFWLARKYRAQCLAHEARLIRREVAYAHLAAVLNRTRQVLLAVPRQLRAQADQQPADVVEKVARNLIATALDTLADRLTEEAEHAD